MRALSTLLRVAAAVMLRLIKGVMLVGLLAGIPYGLLTQIGSPLPDRLPTIGQVRQLVMAPVSDTLVLHILALALWILWIAFVVSVAVEVVAAIRGVPRPRWGPIAPMQSLAGWLVAGITAGVLASAPVMAVAGHAAPAAAVAHVPTHAAAAPTSPPSPTAPFVPAGASADDRGMVLASTTTGITRAPVAQHPVYEVRQGDWLGCIAERYLGSFDRYPEIQRLNPDLIDDPDHIEATWRLILPAEAREHGARPHATGRLVVKPTNGTPPAPAPSNSAPGATPGSPDQGPATPSASAAPGPTTTPTPANTPSAAATSGPAAVSSPTPSGTGTATPTGSGTTGSAKPNTDPPGTSDHDRGVGVPLPGGWISLPFAAALVAAAAMVWLRRRHRYVPQPLSRATRDDPDLRPLPPVMNRIHRVVHQQAPDLLDPPPGPRPSVAEYTAATADDRPDLPQVGPSGLDLAGIGDRVPLGGLGLVGPGAESAARALLVATLSSGSPADPDAKGQVVIPADALTTLLGADAVQIGEMPRLQVTANLSEALMRTEELLIERRRQLEDYDAATVADMRATDPYHPPMPPLLLLSDAPPTELRARLTSTLHLGAPLQISAVLMGEWPRGDTLSVHADGHIAAGGDRLAVLDIPTTMQLLQVLREAHTGEPADAPDSRALSGMDLAAAPPVTGDSAGPDKPAAAATSGMTAQADAGPAPSATVDEPPATAGREPVQASTEPAGDQPSADSAAPLATTAAPGPAPTGTGPAAKRPRRSPVRVQLLGDAVIFDRDGNPVAGLRQHARELLVYLTVHRSGADLPQIMEAFWPTASVPRARERLQTEAGDLRRRIRQAAGDKDIQPVVNTGGRYHLDPNLVDIDVWRLIDTLRQASATTDPAARAALLHQAVNAHTGTLAHGYDWIEQPREHLRRHGIRARLNLADLVAADDPTTAAGLVRAAAALDPINEDLARRAMRALARVGDALGVRAVLGELRTALDDIDEEPSRETIALASELQRDVTATRRTGPTLRNEQSAPDTP